MASEASISRLHPRVTTRPPGRQRRRAQGETTRVLLVDDHPDNLLALEAVLEPLSLRLLKATSGTEALRVLLDQEVAAIVLDVQMPGMDGFEAAELLKSRSATKSIPILFLTAVGDSAEHQVRGYEVGAFDYVCKPYDPSVLRAKVRAMIDWSQQLQAMARLNLLYAESGAAIGSVGTPPPAGKGAFVLARRYVDATFGASAAAPSAARAAISDAIGELLGERRDIVLLLVSELVTNAVLHARSAATVRVELGERTLRAEIEDCGAQLPSVESPAITDENGRGLQMVEQLADRFGWTELPQGKCVWFEMDLPARGDDG